jgi:adenylosuccinate synthase
MPLDVIVGTQWGDEGKGRITDLLAKQAKVVARFSGGDNAGHTVTVGEARYQLHLVPSGIVHTHTLCLLGGGMVVNPARLLEEIDMLTQLGIDSSPARLKLSHTAHIITPAHLALDRALEEKRASAELGTTLRGIGPAYTDKTSRSGIRAGEMDEPEAFAEKIAARMHSTAQEFKALYTDEPPDPQTAARDYYSYAQRLRPYLADVGAHVAAALEREENVLAEGAQGTLLDLDHGTYPYVTSSHPTTAGALLGLAVGPTHLRRIIGVTKAFQTRVGAGAFPTEAGGDVASRLRGTGDQPWDEFGTTTGRPRRCGWLDGVLLRYAVRVNGLTELALTKLDILSGIDPLQICSAYRAGDDTHADLPASPAGLSDFTPEYETLVGWSQSLEPIRRWGDLPPAAQAYIQRVETLTQLPVTLISVGPERDQVILR